MEMITFLFKLFILSILLHIIDNFVLQPICLSRLKQKKTWLYPAESYSKNVLLTKDKVQITPSSFNLTPIKIINL